MTPAQFELILESLCERLRNLISIGGTFPSSIAFETHVRTELEALLEESDYAVNFEPHPHVFPDIVLPPFGIEVKFTLKDTWRSVANSVFESTRAPNVEHVYLLTYHGVLAPQVRDLFTAGSVALRADSTRGGTYIQRSLADIQDEMRQAANYLPDALFTDFWGEGVPKAERISWWLKEADKYAVGWKPSDVLFLP